MPDLLTLLMLTFGFVVAFSLVVLVIILLKQNSYLKRSIKQIEIEQYDIARRELSIEFAEREHETRQDAINKSRAVLTGNMTQHIAPFLPNFPYNPKDARFLGNPIDFVIFDGLSEGNVRAIVLCEVKTGKYAKLNENQRCVRDTARQRNVEWFELKLYNNVELSDEIEESYSKDLQDAENSITDHVVA